MPSAAALSLLTCVTSMPMRCHGWHEPRPGRRPGRLRRSLRVASGASRSGERSEPVYQPPPAAAAPCRSGAPIAKPRKLLSDGGAVSPCECGRPVAARSRHCPARTGGAKKKLNQIFHRSQVVQYSTFFEYEENQTTAAVKCRIFLLTMPKGHELLP